MWYRILAILVVVVSVSACSDTVSCQFTNFKHYDGGYFNDFKESTISKIVKCADRGYEPAQTTLAMAYHNEGTRQGNVSYYRNALYYYKKAAEQGRSIAMLNLALMYSRGEGVEKNKAIAEYWEQKFIKTHRR